MSKAGKKRAYQKFKKEYAKQFPVSTSSLGDYHAFCTVCSVDFGINHGGINDIKKHINSKKHLESSKVKANTLPISKFFASSSLVHSFTYTVCMLKITKQNSILDFFSSTFSPQLIIS